MVEKLVEEGGRALAKSLAETEKASQDALKEHRPMKV